MQPWSCQFHLPVFFFTLFVAISFTSSSHGLDIKEEPVSLSSSSSSSSYSSSWASTLSSTEVADSSFEISNQDKLMPSMSVPVGDSGTLSTPMLELEVGAGRSSNHEDVAMGSGDFTKVQVDGISGAGMESVDVGDQLVIDVHADEVRATLDDRNACPQPNNYVVPSSDSHESDRELGSAAEAGSDDQRALNVDAGPMGVMTTNGHPPAFAAEDPLLFGIAESHAALPGSALVPEEGCSSETGDCQQPTQPSGTNDQADSDQKRPEETTEEDVEVAKTHLEAAADPETREENLQTDPIIDNRSAFDGILDEAFSGEDLWSIENILLKPSGGTEKVATTVAEGQSASTEDMPSFNEWAKKRLEEREKTGKIGQTQSSSGQPGKPNPNHHKMRHKNYASGECGAKMVNVNSEAQNAFAVLNSYKDEYMLNPCTAKIWFVIELCEPIQADRLEMANFELFSSAPKEFSVFATDRFPTREWKSLGNFVAQEGRSMQSFSLQHDAFSKFIKVEMASHYGSEHFCPLSLVRVFGTSEYEALEGEDHDSNPHSSTSDEDEDQTREERDLGVLAAGEEEAQNLFGSAKEAVMSIVKKAARALTRDKGNGGDSQPEAGGNVDGRLGVSQPSAAQQDCVSLQRLPNLDCQDAGNATRYDLLRNQMLTTLRCEFESLQKVLWRFGGPRFWDRCPACRAFVISSESFLKEQACIAWQGLCGYVQAILGPIRFGSLCHLSKLLNDDAKMLPLEVPSCKVFPSTKEAGSSSETTVRCDSAIEYATRTLTNTITLSTHSPAVPQMPTSMEIIGMRVDSAVDQETSPVVVESPLVTEATGAANIQPTKTLPAYTVLGEDFTPGVPFCVEEHSHPPSPVKSYVEGTVSVTAVRKDDADAESGQGHGLEADMVNNNPDAEIAASLGEIVESHIVAQDTVTVAVSVAATVDTVSLVSPVVQGVGEASTVPVVPGPADQVQVQVPPVVEVGSAAEKLAEDRVAADRFGPMGASQKESVFVRLTNRIKALELNMSLSSQYLEELSRRYRRQMEEMQRAFNKTVGALNETARKAYERDMKQQEMISVLQSRVENLTNSVGNLLAQQDSLHTQVIGRHMFLMMVEVLVILAVIYWCTRPAASDTRYEKSYAVTDCSRMEGDSLSTPVKDAKGGGKRRNSVVGTVGYITPSLTNHRRPSEEALDITANHSHLVIVEPSVPILIDTSPVRMDLDLKKKKKSKNRKCSKNLYRSVSNTILPSAARPPPHPPVQRKGSGNNHTSAGVLFGTANSRNQSAVMHLYPPHNGHSSTSSASSTCSGNSMPRTSSPILCEQNFRKSPNSFADEGHETRQVSNGGVSNRSRPGHGISRLGSLIDPKCGGLDQCQDSRQAKGPFNVKKVLQKVYG